MHGRTLGFMVVLVGALAAVALWQKEREERGDFAVAEHLFPGVEGEQISALRLDHIERSFHLRLERGTGDAPWLITDPIEYEAEPGMVQRLLDVVLTHRAGVPPGVAGAEPGAVGFDPPRAILTVEWTGADGTFRESALEVGPLDLDGDHVAVRRGGAAGAGPVRRTLRNLDTLLARTLDEWRSRRISRLAPRTLVSLVREGSLFIDEGEDTLWLDMALERGANGWRLARPEAVLADRDAVELLAAGVARVAVEKFVGDAVETREALALFGLDQPELRLRLEDHRGRREVLEFGRAVIGGTWHARRVGASQVFEVAAHAVLALTPPSELFMERKLVRLPRERMERLTIEGSGAPLVVARKRRPGAPRGAAGGWAWSVSQGHLSWPADGARVAGILAVLEQAEVLYYLSAEAPPDSEAFSAGRSFSLVGGRVTEGGLLGTAYHGLQAGSQAGGSDGGGEAPGVLYLREGDGRACVVPRAVSEALSVTIEELRSPRLVSLEEVALASLVLEGRGRERVFERGRDGLWRVSGERAEARELHPVLDPLLFLRAESFLPPGPQATFEEPVRVTLTARDGSTSWLELGRGAGADGAGLARAGDLRARLADGELHRQLLELLGP